MSEEVLGAVRQQLGCEEPDDESKDDQIKNMGPFEALDRFLAWNGIIGFTSEILAAMDNIREAAGQES